MPAVPAEGSRGVRAGHRLLQKSPLSSISRLKVQLTTWRYLQYGRDVEEVEALSCRMVHKECCRGDELQPHCRHVGQGGLEEDQQLASL
jgi:hypothetical protein